MSFTLSFPYFLYYKQTSEEGEPTYCAADFPIFQILVGDTPVYINMEIVLSLYTVMISYVLPLTTIIFCYMRMILRIYDKSNAEQRLIDGAKSFSNSATATSASAEGLRANLANRQMRVSLDNFGSGKSCADRRRGANYTVGITKQRR